MDSEAANTEHETRAMALANLAIRCQAGGDDQGARRAWLEALDHAERHLPGNTIIFWIRSGLGDSLLRNGDYLGALEMAGSALAYCASVRAPLAALTMTQAHLRLGDVTSARDYARQARELKGENVLGVLSPVDRDMVGLAIPT